MEQPEFTLTRFNQKQRAFAIISVKDLNYYDRVYGQDVYPGGANYLHLPGRDLAKDLKKAQRKWNIKPRALQTPVMKCHYGNEGVTTLIDRTLNHFRARLLALGDDPMQVLIITLFKPTRPMTHKFNWELKLFALQDSRIHLQYVDPVDWGLA